MATVVNFIDTTLQAAGTRTVPVAGTSAVDWQGAATTALWSGIPTGTGKPADNATVGAIIGTNLSGQFTSANASTFIASSAISQAMLAAGIIDLTKFASGIEPVTMVTSVPGTKSTYSIFNTTDGKLYRWNGSAYVATVATTDLSGTLADAQIAALAASKITGTLSDSQLAAIAAAKITGTLSDAQLAAIAASKVTGQIVSTQITDGSIATAKLAANAVTAAKITAGTITSNEIAAATITGTNIAGTTITAAKMVAGTITSNEIAAAAITGTNIAGGTITGAKMVAGTVTANEIAADTITAANIAANAITASELSADSVIAGKIAAAAISAREIQAGAITADRLAVGDFTNLCDNPDFELGLVGWIVSGGGDVVTVDPAGAYNGRNYFAVPASIPTAVLRNTNFVSVLPGDQFYARAWIKSVGADTGYVRITWFDKNGAEVSSASASDSIHSGYTLSEVFFTAPPGAVKILVEAVLHTSAGGGMRVDGVGLFRMAGATLIQDGAITTNKILAGAVTADRITASSLSAISAELGSAVISTTGSLRSGQTAYDTGTGFWLGLASGTPKFSIGTAGGPSMKWDGSQLRISQATFDSLGVTLSGTLATSVANGLQGYGNTTATATGGTVQSYVWSITYGSDTGAACSYRISAGDGTSVISTQGSVTNNLIHAVISCTVTFSDGRTATAARQHNVTHGTYTP